MKGCDKDRTDHRSSLPLLAPYGRCPCHLPSPHSLHCVSVPRSRLRRSLVTASLTPSSLRSRTAATSSRSFGRHSSHSVPLSSRVAPFGLPPAARNVKRETVENERNHIINLLSLHFIYSLITFLFSSLLHRLVSTPYLPHLTRSSLGSYGAEWSVTRRWEERWGR